MDKTYGMTPSGSTVQLENLPSSEAGPMDFGEDQLLLVNIPFKGSTKILRSLKNRKLLT